MCLSNSGFNGVWGVDITVAKLTSEVVKFNCNCVCVEDSVQSCMTIKKTEFSAQHEFLKPIYLCIYRVIILKYLGVQQKC